MDEVHEYWRMPTVRVEVENLQDKHTMRFKMNSKFTSEVFRQNDSL